MAYWIQCRYMYSKRKFDMMKMQTMLQTHAALAGTTEEQILDSELGSKPVEV